MISACLYVYLLLEQLYWSQNMYICKEKNPVYKYIGYM